MTSTEVRGGCGGEGLVISGDSVESVGVCAVEDSNPTAAREWLGRWQESRGRRPGPAGPKVPASRRKPGKPGCCGGDRFFGSTVYRASFWRPALQGRPDRLRA